MKRAMSRRFLVCLILVGVTLSAVPAFSSSLTGSQVTGTLFFPNLSTVFSGPLTAIVGPTVEFPAGTLAFDGSLDITDSQIIWTATLNENYGAGAFNGFELVFSGAPTITGVSLDSGTTLTPVSFSTMGGNVVLLNLEGLTAVAGQKTILDVTTSSPSTTPEPTAIVLLATGLLGITLAAKRKIHL